MAEPRVISALVLSMILAFCYAQAPTAFMSDGTLGTVVTLDGRVFNITGGITRN